MSADDKPYQATPSLDLRQQIMDSRVPKNEREWWASRTIEKLERERDQLRADVDRLTIALKDAIWTYNPNCKETLVTAERQEAWIAALQEDAK